MHLAIFSRPSLLCLSLASGLALFAGGVNAVVVPAALPPSPDAVPILAEAANPDKVKLLVGLTELQAEVQYFLIVAQADGVGAAGEHLTEAVEEAWPSVKDGVLAAGGPDLAPLLADLQAAGDLVAINKALAQVTVGISKARSAIAPTNTDEIAVILAQGELIGAGLAATTPAQAETYGIAWSILILTRNELDILSRDPDPAVVKAAGEVALALDDLIISLPDPSQADSVTVDPATVQNAMQPLKAVAGEV